MEAAFDRLTEVQKANVNKQMFIFAYNCIVRSRNDPDRLIQEIERETENFPHLKEDLVRYCKLVKNVM